MERDPCDNTHDGIWFAGAKRRTFVTFDRLKAHRAGIDPSSITLEKFYKRLLQNGNLQIFSDSFTRPQNKLRFYDDSRPFPPGGALRWR
jgi:hypothetical protein